METRPNPATARKQLGDKLRELRERAGFTSARVARTLGWSESKISRIETGRTLRITSTDLDKLCRAYGVDSAVREGLEDLAAHASRVPRPRSRGGWRPIRSEALAEPYEQFINYEQNAIAVVDYEVLVVPGLLQTDEYARAIIAADSSVQQPHTIEQRVAARLARQAVLTRQPVPPDLTFFIDEAVLRRPVGGAPVMYRQIRQLIADSERSNVTIRVLPFALGAHRGLGGSFIMLEMPPESGGTVIYAEGVTGGVLRSKPGEVAPYRDSLAAISEIALSSRDSAAFLAATAEAVAESGRSQAREEV